jgi:hypothetical protein
VTRSPTPELWFGKPVVVTRGGFLGTAVTRDLAHTIQELRGEVEWDPSKPDGQPTGYLREHHAMTA